MGPSREHRKRRQDLCTRCIVCLLCLSHALFLTCMRDIACTGQKIRDTRREVCDVGRNSFTCCVMPAINHKNEGEKGEEKKLCKEYEEVVTRDSKRREPKMQRTHICPSISNSDHPHPSPRYTVPASSYVVQGLCV